MLIQISVVKILYVPILSEATHAPVKLATSREPGVVPNKSAMILTNVLLAPTIVVITQHAATLMAHLNVTVTPDSNVVLSVLVLSLAQVSLTKL